MLFFVVFSLFFRLILCLIIIQRFFVLVGYFDSVHNFGSATASEIWCIEKFKGPSKERTTFMDRETREGEVKRRPFLLYYLLIEAYYAMLIET